MKSANISTDNIEPKRRHKTYRIRRKEIKNSTSNYHDRQIKSAEESEHIKEFPGPLRIIPDERKLPAESIDDENQKESEQMHSASNNYHAMTQLAEATQLYDPFRIKRH